MESFKALNLSNSMLNALKGIGYLSPSPIQLEVIPKALKGESLVCQAPTGSGKTHAFLVPIIDRLDLNLNKLQAIVIAPSRELARQSYLFAKEFEKYFPKLKVRLFTSETEVSDNKEGLSVVPQLVIGTPGRLKDILLGKYPLDLRQVKTLVLDEADMLLEMGYFQDVSELYALLGDKVQTMVFSATLREDLVSIISSRFSADFVYLGGQEKTSSNVSHHLVDIRHDGLENALIAFLKAKKPYLAIVFASSKESAKNAFLAVKGAKLPVVLFTGDLSARERKKTIRMIKEGVYPIVISSDLLCRGMDIDDVSDVISLEVPSDLTYYFHRAGRTGRFDKKGDSYLFYNVDTIDIIRPLLSKGIKFDHLLLKDGKLVSNPKPLPGTSKVKRKAQLPPNEIRDIKKAKAMSSSKKVKPGYKKKQAVAIEKVKRRYKRKAIKASINKNKKGA